MQHSYAVSPTLRFMTFEDIIKARSPWWAVGPGLRLWKSSPDAARGVPCFEMRRGSAPIPTAGTSSVLNRSAGPGQYDAGPQLFPEDLPALKAARKAGAANDARLMLLPHVCRVASGAWCPAARSHACLVSQGVDALEQGMETTRQQTLQQLGRLVPGALACLCHLLPLVLCR
jgi:hypothetical protein